MKAINPILRQIVNRCHVSDTDEKVLDYAISRLKHGMKTFEAMTKTDQNEMKRQCKAIHASNKKL